MKWLTGLAAGLALSAGTVHAADKWDMPTAYVDSNYHTQNGKLFAEAVGVCTGGDLEIVVHGGGSLFKGGEIKHAVQTGWAPIGERLLSAHQSENAVFGFDSVPFLRLVVRGIRSTLAGGQGQVDRDPRRAESGTAVFHPLATAGDVLRT